MKILILGSQGNLGQDLVSVFLAAGHEVVGCGRDQLDVTVEAAVRAMIGCGFSAVINAVAYNNGNAAEDPANRPIAWNPQRRGAATQARPSAITAPTTSSPATSPRATRRTTHQR